MSNVANTYTSMTPDLKEAYPDKNKRFQKIQSKLRKEHQKHDKKCNCQEKSKCPCKE